MLYILDSGFISEFTGSAPSISSKALTDIHDIDEEGSQLLSGMQHELFNKLIKSVIFFEIII